MVYIDSYTIV